MNIHEIITGTAHSLKKASPDARVLCKDSVCGCNGADTRRNSAGNCGCEMPACPVAPILSGCRITFGLMNHRKTVTLSVPEKIYETINVGSIGKLEFTGKRFEKFVLSTAD